MKAYTHGNICDFSFYVMSFDTKSHYTNFHPPIVGLTLEQAKKEFEKQCALNPMYVNTMLGVDFVTKRKDLEPMGRGAADLLQCVKGVLHLSQDYMHSAVLARESLIAINTVEILKKECDRLQRNSDKATSKCSELLRLNADTICNSDEDVQNSFLNEMVTMFGLERCKLVLANEFFGRQFADVAAFSNAAEYLEDSYHGDYQKRFGLNITAEQADTLTEVLKRVEALSETEGKLYRAGLVYGDGSKEISERADMVAAEIEHHNVLEDSGQVSDDQLSL